jgi:hypothetical protein
VAEDHELAVEKDARIDGRGEPRELREPAGQVGAIPGVSACLSAVGVGHPGHRGIRS